MNPLVFQLQEAGYGFHIGDKYVGALVYGDDVILLGSTITSLRLMLNTVNHFGKEFVVKFNPNKSQYIVFGNSKSIPMSIKFNKTHLSPFQSAKCLGVIIGKNCPEAQIKVAKTELRRRFNALNNMFKLKYSLFKSFCMALYSCVLWDLTSNLMSKFFIYWRKCIRNLLDVSPMTHSEYLPLIVEDLPIEAQLPQILVKFINSMIQSENPMVNLFGQLLIVTPLYAGIGI